MPSHDNLPPQFTSFIGREKEKAEIKRQLYTTRLLTLTGTGGSGKTRLALEIARELYGDYSDGVWLVELAAISDPTLVPQAVASVLSVREQPGQPLLSNLADHLGPLRVLLVLDNCEHLVSACALVADALLRACPELVILATSRQSLGIAGESTFQIPSLTLPDPRERLNVELFVQFEAVRLFVERAGFSRPSFALTEQNAPFVAQLCNRLDGLPLAIELAAARINVLSVEQIVSHLDERFRLLTTGSPLAMHRQQSLQALLDWSYYLLSDAEQAFLRALSVFAGTFSLDAAKALRIPVSESQGDPAEPANRFAPDEFAIIDLLSGLISKSLLLLDEYPSVSQLVSEESPPSSPLSEGQNPSSREARYRLLETIKEYAGEKLRHAGEEPVLRDSHRDYYVTLGEALQKKLVGAEQTAALNAFEIEHDNFRAALDWSVRCRPDAGSALRLGSALWRFWDMRGYLTEGARWLRDALAIQGDATLVVRAKALNAAGNLALDHGEYDDAERLYEEALALRREMGDPLSIAGSLSNLGVVARQKGDYAKAVELYEQALALFREDGNIDNIAGVLDNLGFVVQCMGDYDRAESLYHEALELFDQEDDAGGIALVYNNLGEVSLCRNDYTRAAAYFRDAVDVARQVGDKLTIVGALNNLGTVANHEGHYELAEDIFVDSLDMCQDLDNKQGIVECLEGLAAARVRSGAPGGGQPELAARLFGAAEALREKIATPVSPSKREERDRYVERARLALGEETFAALWATGRTMTLDAAIVRALEAVQEVMVGRLPGIMPDPPYAVELTRREAEVLSLAANGFTDAQIAEKLQLSTRTVNSHLHSTYNKLNVPGRGAAARWARDNGLV
jgi:non-specific serine/threonine protein kinase